VLCDLEGLEELRVFPHRWQRNFLKTRRGTLEETRTWADFEVVEVLHQREERDWTSFDRIRQRSVSPGRPTRAQSEVFGKLVVRRLVQAIAGSLRLIFLIALGTVLCVRVEVLLGFVIR
jgi:hypothetical protein